MLSSISWQQYLTFMSGICFIYYLSILLWFYKFQFLQIIGFSKMKHPDDPLNLGFEHSILGKAKNDDAFESISAEELAFSETNSENENPLNPIANED